MDEAALRAEAKGFARAMHDTGLVSDYHAAFLRWIVGNGWSRLVPAALGLGETGRDGVRCFEDLVLRLIRDLEARVERVAPVVDPTTSTVRLTLLVGGALVAADVALYEPGDPGEPTNARLVVVEGTPTRIDAVRFEAGLVTLRGELVDRSMVAVDADVEKFCAWAVKWPFR